uniref:Uncharacterized protein n=1 Tax=Anopheles farauti TaxID=69004 RepID=A0A182QLA8_9DIPT
MTRNPDDGWLVVEPCSPTTTATTVGIISSIIITISIIGAAVVSCPFQRNFGNPRWRWWFRLFRVPTSTGKHWTGSFRLRDGSVTVKRNIYSPVQGEELATGF